jgi:hypothetical protein
VSGSIAAEENHPQIDMDFTDFKSVSIREICGRFFILRKYPMTLPRNREGIWARMEERNVRIGSTIDSWTPS